MAVAPGTGRAHGGTRPARSFQGERRQAETETWSPDTVTATDASAEGAGPPFTEPSEAENWLLWQGQTMTPFATDATAQLMELRKAEALGVFDHHHRCVGNIDANFYDRSRHKNMNAIFLECAHDLLFALASHPPVEQLNFKLRFEDARNFL